jgi:TonB family protein
MPAPISFGASDFTRLPELLFVGSQLLPSRRSCEGGAVPSYLFALAIVVSSGSANVDKPVPVSGSLSGIVTADDYPADALDLNQQGSVGVLVRVDAKGAVSDCVVTVSSGSPALDAQTCRLVWLRARFTPARDGTGAPVASTYQQRINWRIGDDDEGASSEPWMVRWIVNGWENGFPSCRSELGGASEGDNAGPAQCPPYVAGVPASLPVALSPYSDLIIEQRFSIGAIPTIALAPTDQFLGRELARLDIDSTGKVTSCKVLETAGLIPPQVSRACLITAKHYMQKKDASGSPAPFAAYFMIGVYAHKW